MSEIFGIIRHSSDKEKTKSAIAEKYDLSDQETTFIFDMPLSDITADKQERLDYYRTYAGTLSRLIKGKEDADNNTSYIELMEH